MGFRSLFLCLRELCPGPRHVLSDDSGESASLNSDHELVTSGQYRLVRHPIYTSMLLFLCGTGLMITPLPLPLLATAVFMLGTEIRVQIEDRLLASRFGDRLRQYQRRVPAYIPFVK